MKPKPKLFVIRKYIKAYSAAEAIKKDRTTPPDEVWIDDDWKNGNRKELADAIGFKVSKTDSEDDSDA